MLVLYETTRYFSDYFHDVAVSHQIKNFKVNCGYL